MYSTRQDYVSDLYPGLRQTVTHFLSLVSQNILLGIYHQDGRKSGQLAEGGIARRDIGRTDISPGGIRIIKRLHYSAVKAITAAILPP